MELMKNKYLVFDKIEFNGKLTSNITDISVLPTIPQKYYDSGDLKPYTLQDDEFIETVSHKLYNDTGYWDILMKINGITNIRQLPKSRDILLSRAYKQIIEFGEIGKLIYNSTSSLELENVLEKLNNNIPILGEDSTSLKYIEILNKLEDDNEIFRNIYYLELDKMNDLLKELSEEIELNKNDMKNITKFKNISVIPKD